MFRTDFMPTRVMHLDIPSQTSCIIVKKFTLSFLFVLWACLAGKVTPIKGLRV
jgi:hypothetical protein